MFPGLLYVKLAGIAALVAGAGYVAWNLRGANAEEETREAIQHAVKDIQAKLDAETQLRQQYSTLADEKLAELLKSISAVQATQRVISAGIAAERKRDPKFYNQPLPEGGLQEWKRARALVSAAPASAASSSQP